MRPYCLSVMLPLLLGRVAGADVVTVVWSAGVEDVSISAGSFGDRVTLPGCAPLARPGDPALPADPVCVSIPFGMEVDSITVTAMSETVLPGTHDIRPMQRAVPVSMPEAFTPTPRNTHAYAGIVDLPVVTLAGQGSLMGFPVADLVVRPLVWDPVTGILTLRTSLTIELHCSPARYAAAPAARSAASELLAREIVTAAVINPADVPTSGATTVSRDELPWGDYLIITPQSLVPAFEPLAEFKTTLGVPTVIVTTEYIGANYSGVDQAQEIRFFLRDIWDEAPPSYVLLGGDAPQVDARNCWATAEGYVGDPAADIYFSDMNDTAPGTDAWDHDNDGTWGEIGQDLMDYHPDYLVGRAAVNNAAEAAIFVDKVLAFQIPSVDARDTDPWYTSMGFTTGVLWTSPYCPGSAGKEKVDTLYTPPAWQPVVKHYESAGTQSYAATMEMLNGGMQLVNHAGHGSETLVSIGPAYLQNSDFMGLTNISAHGRVSIWNTIACLSGSFDTGECLAEAWLNSPNGGGFCMMNTRYGWGEPSDPGNQWSDLVDQQFFAEFFVNDMYHLGAAHALAWDEFIPLISSDTHYDWIAKSITLFGDPELPMWLDEPDGALAMSAPDFAVEGPNTIVVTLSDGGGPVEGGRVCLMQGGWEDPVAYEVAFTDASGQASVDIVLEVPPAELSISGWARNHAPVTETIPVENLGVGDDETPGASWSLGLPHPSPASGIVSIPVGCGGGVGSLVVHDLAGRVVMVVDDDLASSGTAVWDLHDFRGNAVPSGIYLVRLVAPGFEEARRLVVIR